MNSQPIKLRGVSVQVRGIDFDSIGKMFDTVVGFLSDKKFMDALESLKSIRTLLGGAAAEAQGRTLTQEEIDAMMKDIQNKLAGAVNPDMLKTQALCETGGYYWYDGACHAEAKKFPWGWIAAGGAGVILMLVLLLRPKAPVPAI